MLGNLLKLLWDLWALIARVQNKTMLPLCFVDLFLVEPQDNHWWVFNHPRSDTWPIQGASLEVWFPTISWFYHVLSYHYHIKSLPLYIPCHPMLFKLFCTSQVASGKLRNASQSMWEKGPSAQSRSHWDTKFHLTNLSELSFFSRAHWSAFLAKCWLWIGVAFLFSK